MNTLIEQVYQNTKDIQEIKKLLEEALERTAFLIKENAHLPKYEDELIKQYHKLEGLLK